MANFWQKLNKPIYALAPMAGFTDSAFRQICKQFGADLVYSEMASATALVYNPKKTLEMLEFSKMERPYVVQLFGANPDHFVKAVKIIERKIKPDGIDINFGCPVKKIKKQGAGAVLMDNLKLSRQIIKSVIDNTDLPVSIKLRSKVGQTDALKFLGSIRDLDVKGVMIHGRSLAQGHKGEIDWKIIRKARNYFKGVILANGGVGLSPSPSPSQTPPLTPPLIRGGELKGRGSSQEKGVLDYANWLLEKTGADGLGIARGALGRPWIFREVAKKRQKTPSNAKEILKVMLEHAKLVERLKGSRGIVEMRKHLCWYAQGMPGAKKLRQRFIKVETSEDVKKILK